MTETSKFVVDNILTMADEAEAAAERLEAEARHLRSMASVLRVECSPKLHDLLNTPTVFREP